VGHNLVVIDGFFQSVWGLITGWRWRCGRDGENWFTYSNPFVGIPLLMESW